MPYKDQEQRRAYGRAASKRYRERHPERQRQVIKNWQKRWPEKYAEIVRASNHKRKLSGQTRARWLLSQYGLSVQEYETMLSVQFGLCAICKTNPAEHVDHDHGTRLVRGLVCGGCNRGLGCFEDDPKRMREAANYILRSLGKSALVQSQNDEEFA